MNILIPNAPDKRNLGDLAIFEQLVAELREQKSTSQIVAHVFHPLRFGGSKGFVVRPNIYFWVVFHKRDFLNRSRRMIALILALLLPDPMLSFVSPNLEKILRDYQKADRIILEGGGYFRSKSGFTQQLNAMMIGLPLLFGRKYRKTIIIRPMSFGPFSNRMTEWACAKLISLADTVYLRDAVSYSLLKKYIPVSKLKQAPDDALMLLPIKVKKHKKRTLGFTIREWEGSHTRALFIRNFAELVKQACKEQHCSEIQPIIQVNAPAYKEGDEQITQELSQKLHEMGLSIRKIVRPKTVNQALRAYGKLSFLVGMRMHSCIFAKTQGVPFTAIAYEHKHQLLEKDGHKVIPVQSLIHRERLVNKFSGVAC